MSGYVLKIVNEGILVTVTSLGALNVTGLVSKKDLPKQFEVPPDLTESFQNQLLAQDFVVGREITCGILKVHPNPSNSLVYNLKMLFEEFGEMPSDGIEVIDKFDTLSDAEKDAIVTERMIDMNDDDEEEEEEEEEEDGFDDDLGRISTKFYLSIHLSIYHDDLTNHDIINFYRFDRYI